MITVLSVACIVLSYAYSKAGDRIGGDTSQIQTLNDALTKQSQEMSQEMGRQSQEISALQHSTAQQANTAHLGVCWSVVYNNSNGVTWATNVDISPPIVTDGVYQCPQGYTFAAVAPQPQG